MLCYLILASLFETFTVQCNWIGDTSYYLPYQKLERGLSCQFSLFKHLPITEQVSIPTKICVNINKHKPNLKVQNLSFDWQRQGISLSIGRQGLKNVGYSQVSNLLLNEWAPAVDGVDFKFNIAKYKVHTFVACLERDGPIKDPYLWLFSIGRDFGRLCISANRITILGGKGRPIKLKYLWHIIKGTNPKDRFSPIQTDNLFSFTYKYSIGGVSFWGEIGAQDWHAEGAFYPRWTAFVWGIRADFEKSTFITEYATTNPEWYHHGEYGAYTHAGEPLGHRMGHDAHSIFFKFLSRLNSSWFWQLSYFLTLDKSPIKYNSLTEWKAALFNREGLFFKSIINIKEPSFKKQCAFIIGYMR